MGFKSISLAAIALVVSTSVNAALIERLDGLAYYDDTSDLTWMADAKAAGIAMDWATSNSWAASLDIDGVAGADGWRLSTSDERSCSLSFSCKGSEMGNLLFGLIGTTTPFSNANTGFFWSSENTTNPSLAWGIRVDNNMQSATLKTNLFDSYAWAVYDGDIALNSVSAVPVPAAAWLFGSGLIGLIGLARRKK